MLPVLHEAAVSHALLKDSIDSKCCCGLLTPFQGLSQWLDVQCLYHVRKPVMNRSCLSCQLP